jgi:hypothetical protein
MGLIFLKKLPKHPARCSDEEIVFWGSISREEVLDHGRNRLKHDFTD